MRDPESAPRGPEEGPETCPQLPFCLKGLLRRAEALAAAEQSIETDPALIYGLDQSVVDETDGIYSLACQAAKCETRYVVGKTIEPQIL